MQTMIGLRARWVALAAGLAVVLALPPLAAGDAAVDVAADAARPWPALQQADGRFYDYVSGAADGVGRYGEAMLGYALLRTGLRTSDQAQVDTALRAIGFVLGHPELQQAAPSVFETYALAASYNLARARLGGDPRFAALAPAWQARLASERPLHLRGRAGFWNKTVVEAVAVLELLRSGVRSPTPRTWLYDRKRARRLATQLVNRVVPARARRMGPVAMLSDPPAAPLAYHALALGFYARAVRLLGTRAAPRAKRVVLGAARASRALAAPDGDVAYAGRSQEQAWALAFTTYGARVAARYAAPREAAQLRGLARRALGRLSVAYPVIDGGLAIVPAFAAGPRTWFRGIDAYAAAGAYNGLTIVALDLAADVPERPGDPVDDVTPLDVASAIAADAGDMAVLRRGSVWMAVKRLRAKRDLRYDFGLVALKCEIAGRWRDILPLRPHAGGPSFGPILLAAGRAHEPWGRHVAAARGQIRVSGGFRGIAGRTTFEYTPSADGTVLRFRGRPHATYRYSTVFPAQAAPQPFGDRAVTGGGQLLTVNSTATMTFTPGFSSATEPDLVRADLTFAVGASGRARIAISGAG